MKSLSLHNNPLRWRVALLFAFVTVFIWTGIGYSIWTNYRNTLFNAETDALNLARSLAAHTTATFEAIEARLHAIESDYRDTESLLPVSSKGTSLITHHIVNSTSIDSCSIFNAQGELLQAAIPNQNGMLLKPETTINISDRNYFKKISTSTQDQPVFIAHPIKGKLTDKWLLPVIRKMHQKDGKFDGLILATIELRTFWQKFFEGFNLDKNNSIALVDKDGYFMARAPFKELFFTKSFEDNIFFREQMPNFKANVFYDDQSIDKQERMIAFHNLDDLPLAISVTQSMNTVLRQWYQNTTAMLLIGLVVNVLLFYYSRSLMSQAAQLVRHHEELEQRVKERTLELQVSEAELRSNNETLNAISRLQAHFIKEPDPAAMFDNLLKDILKITNSEYGLIGDVLTDENDRKYLKCYAFSNVSWNEETRRFYEENKATGFVFTKLDNLFGRVILDRQVVIANDPAHDPRRAGIPKGHPKINAFLGIPVWYGDRLVGEIGLANRPEGYDEKVLESIRPLVEATGRIIAARWDRQARLEAENALQEYKDNLEQIVQQRTTDLQNALISAEQANHAKSVFLANMSHELRTPMHAILSFSSLALKRIEDQKAIHFLENIQTSGNRLTGLLNDLLDLSKLEAGKMEVNFVELDIINLIQDTIDEVESLLAEKSISIKLNSELHFNCVIDQKLFTQVMMNLFSNALKFSPENGVINIDIKRLKSEPNDKKQEIAEIVVIDEGVGIPKEELELIFDQFEQSSQTNSSAGGTGLGLPITRRIIELHKGKVWAESPPDGQQTGSAFFIQIPIHQAV